ncbi:MAG: CDP-alcohol phosphatidyltransferase family protein, partial [Ruminococcus sp.]|nr:CDP-alcohol phosphatidyltransferase family protein [Ruminococcus sp.]
MNLPNKLTVARILLVPFFVAALLIDFPLNNLVALALFGAASLTDMFDGKIARKHGLITDFGKFADPLADKILVISALLCFVQLGLCDCVAVIIV